MAKKKAPTKKKATTKKPAAKKQRAKHYEPKLKVFGTFSELVKVSVSKAPNK